jgi:hypothetical protein
MKRVAVLFGSARIGALSLDERLTVLLEHSMRLCDRSSNSGERNQWSTHFPLTHDRFEAPKFFNKKAPVASRRRARGRGFSLNAIFRSVRFPHVRAGEI